MRRTDPLIIGAGPAGCAAAITLARGDAKPLILESTAEQGDALCGGFVSWRTLQSIRALGVDLGQLGGHPARHLRLFAGSSQARTALPAQAIGISRARLDAALLAEALKAGACLERGAPVRSLEADGSILLKDGEHFAGGH